MTNQPLDDQLIDVTLPIDVTFIEYACRGEHMKESAISMLSAALTTSVITDLNISFCGLSPQGVTVLAASLSTAAVKVVDMSGNLNIGGSLVNESTEPIDVMVEQLFVNFDVDGEGRLGKHQYKAFLTGIGVWGSAKYQRYTNLNWDSEWPSECQQLGSTAEKGIDREAFTVLYTKHRSKDVGTDHAKVYPCFDHLETLFTNSNLWKVKLANCGLGPKAIKSLASALSTAMVEWLDISKNMIGVDGAKALVSALPNSSIKTLIFGPAINLQINALEPEPVVESSTAKVTSFNFSEQQLGPAELIIVAWWLNTDGPPAVDSMDMSGNPITSGKIYNRGAQVGESDGNGGYYRAAGSAIRAVQVGDDIAGRDTRHVFCREWELTQGPTIATALLNGLPLAVDEDRGGGGWRMPPMEPRESDATSPLVVTAQSYSFVALPTVLAPACTRYLEQPHQHQHRH